MNQPDIVITHGPACADGWAAAWTVHQKWPQVPVHVGIYGEPPPDVTDLGVLITDFSYPEDVLREMAASAKWIHVLDHHATAEAHLRKLAAEHLIHLWFDLERSGAALAFDYAWGQGRIPPMLIQYVEDRDLWRFNLEGTRAVHAVLMSHPQEFPAWSFMAKRLEDPGQRAQMIREGESILRDRDRMLNDIIFSGYRTMMIDGHDIPVCNLPYQMASDAGNLMAEGFPFAATYFDRSDGQRQFSLRSTEEGLDVGEIAKKFGGGGHKHAAGFTLPAEQVRSARPKFDLWPQEEDGKL
jgi:oligoribonuclease NrnB/cAMP/cGMP phosphodiesterase (DHH superfamily)